MNTRTVGWSSEVLGRGLALGPVVPDAGAGGLEFGERIAGDDPVEFGMAERSAAAATAGSTRSLGADVRAVDDGGERDRSRRSQRVGRSGRTASPVEFLDEQVDRATAREPDGERLVVGVAERDDPG